MTHPLHPAVRWALAPAGAVFGRIISARNALFDAEIFSAERLSVPVLCVGNLTTGGTGKTPIVSMIAARLTTGGLRVAILSRGYGGAAGAGPLVLRDGRLDSDAPPADPATTGDEPILLSHQLPGVPIVIGADRRLTGRFAVERLGAQVLLLDDGFQHRRLARDLDIVALDAMDPFGHYHMLPSGLLREPISALRRAGVIVVTRSHPDDPLETLRKVLSRMNPAAPVFRAWHRPLGLVPIAAGAAAGGDRDPGWLSGRKVAAFCAIGNPEGFHALLESVGVAVVLFRAWRDHHRYAPEELESFADEARRAGAEAILTTEKDAVRLSLQAPPTAGSLPLLALRVRCEIEREEEFFALIAERAGLTAEPRE